MFFLKLGFSLHAVGCVICRTP